MSKVLLSPATLVGGSLAGALLLAVYLGVFANDPPSAPPSVAAAPAASLPPPAPPAPVAAVRPAAPVQAAVQPVVQACPGEALGVPRGDGDGRFTLQAALSTGARIEPAAFLAVAREATQHGRLRDAEVALLAACHAAQGSEGARSVPLADLKSEIGQQYVALAARETVPAIRQDLLKRAASFLSESAISYATVLGGNASKTRLAEQRLAALHDPATLRLARSDPAAGASSAMGAARESAEDEVNATAEGCSGSAVGRLVCADPELAQLDRDLRRLHAQASSVSRDPGGLRQRDQQALARRDSACRDKACLLRWYAQRRQQLLEEF